MQKIKYNQGFSAIALIIIILAIIILAGGAYYYFSNRHVSVTSTTPNQNIPAVNPSSENQPSQSASLTCDKVFPYSIVNSAFPSFGFKAEPMTSGNDILGGDYTSC